MQPCITRTCSVSITKCLIWSLSVVRAVSTVDTLSPVLGRSSSWSSDAAVAYDCVSPVARDRGDSARLPRP